MNETFSHFGVTNVTNYLNAYRLVQSKKNCCTSLHHLDWIISRADLNLRPESS